MGTFVRISSEATAPVEREKRTHTEEVTFDEATLQDLQAAVSEVLALAAGSDTTMKMAVDVQGHSVLTVTWDTF